jgi:photosystem II stability/assembly factor-like uncharacterized protein
MGRQAAFTRCGYRLLINAVLLLAAFQLAGCGKFDRTAIKMPTFKFVTTENLHSIAYVDEQHIWFSGNYGTILFSSDGGSTWTKQETGLNTELLCTMAFADTRRGWAAGTGGTIMHTVDGGTTWSRQQSGVDGHILDMFFLDAERGWAVGEFGLIIHTADGGATWSTLSEPMDTLYNDVYFVDPLTGWIVGEFGTILHTRDGGETWISQTWDDGRDDAVIDDIWERPRPSLYGTWFQDSRRGWIVGMDGIILHTDDGGNIWERLASGTDKPLYSICIRGSRAWITGNKGAYLSSEDGGMVWTVHDEAIKTKYWLRDVAFINETQGLIVGASGTIIRSSDGGQSWDILSGFRYDIDEFGLADF